MTPVFEGVAEGETVRRSVHFDTEHCYLVLARGGEGLRDVDLFLFDARGADVARDIGQDVSPTLDHCPERRATTPSKRARSRGGTARTHRARRTTPRRPRDARAGRRGSGFGPHGASLEHDCDTRRARLQHAALRRTRFRDRPSEVRIHESFLSGGCAVVLGAASGEVDLDLYLSDANDTMLDRDTGMAPVARVSACVTSSSLLRVRVKGYGHEGTYSLVMVRAPARISDLASLRLEQVAAPLYARGYTTGPLTTVGLEEGQKHAMRLVIPRGRCAALAVAGDQGIDDLDVFLRDAVGTLLASDAGPTPYAAVSRCATDAEQTVVAEIALYGGAGSVMISRLDGSP